MDKRGFDELARTLSSFSSRRLVCKAFSVALVGTALSRLGVDEAAAGCKKARKRCKKSDECCGNLECDKPTTRHTCDSTVGRTKKWCCIPKGERCNGECDCCGDNYCGGNGRCVKNPEG